LSTNAGAVDFFGKVVGGGPMITGGGGEEYEHDTDEEEGKLLRSIGKQKLWECFV